MCGGGVGLGETQGISQSPFAPPSNELRSIPMLMGPRKIGGRNNTWATNTHVVAFKSPAALPG
jgi:hypothetical protein